MPKIDVSVAPRFEGSAYPKPFDEPCKGREGVRLGVAGGLTQFGVNLVTLKPGAWSSQRHWHMKEDELAYVVSGEVVLIEDEGETVLRAGDFAAWKAGIKNGHHLINRTDMDAKLLVLGTRDDSDWGEYPDIDLKFDPVPYSEAGGAVGGFAHKDGTPY
ncbi:MAG: cupin domain-containing protein [Alphaproteobacteria bacterium]